MTADIAGDLSSLENLLDDLPPVCDMTRKPESMQTCGKTAHWRAHLPCGCRPGNMFACHECKVVIDKDVAAGAICIACKAPVGLMRWTPL